MHDGGHICGTLRYKNFCGLRQVCKTFSQFLVICSKVKYDFGAEVSSLLTNCVQEHMVSYMYLYILLRREEDEEGVTSYSAVVKAESLACTRNSTSSEVVASVQVKA